MLPCSEGADLGGKWLLKVTGLPPARLSLSQKVVWEKTGRAFLAGTAAPKPSLPAAYSTGFSLTWKQNIHSHIAARQRALKLIRNRQLILREAKRPDFVEIRHSAHGAFSQKPVSHGVTTRSNIKQKDRVRQNKGLFLHTKDCSQQLLSFNERSKDHPLSYVSGTSWTGAGPSHGSRLCTLQKLAPSDAGWKLFSTFHSRVCRKVFSFAGVTRRFAG